MLLGMLLISTPLLCCCLPFGVSTLLNNSRLLATHKMREILEATQFADAVSLYDYDGTSSSATGGGGHSFVKALYGTQHAYEEIFDAYREQLTSDGWEEFTDGVWRKRTDGTYQMSVENVLNWIRMPGIDTIPEEVIVEGLKEYETVFIVSILNFP
jgi:hypothetical protein